MPARREVRARTARRLSPRRHRGERIRHRRAPEPREPRPSRSGPSSVIVPAAWRCDIDTPETFERVSARVTPPSSWASRAGEAATVPVPAAALGAATRSSAARNTPGSATDGERTAAGVVAHTHPRSPVALLARGPHRVSPGAAGAVDVRATRTTRCAGAGRRPGAPHRSGRERDRARRLR